MLVAASAMTACFDKPPRPVTTVDGPESQACTSRDPHDDFMMTMTCGSWGTPTGNVMEGGGTLTITPADANPAGCTTTMPADFSTPVFVAVPIIPSGDGTVAFFAQATGQGYVSSHVELRMQSGSSYLFVVDDVGRNSLGDLKYDAASMLWWRLRPAPVGVYGEYSADGITWLPIGLVPGTPPPAIMISLTAENFSGFADGSAVFQSFDICP
jgi:hypothetical protein